jgi:hypothetical protein
MDMRKKENGQILVILALAMVALLAITALAIDGSLVYNDRREDQSTADSAALAGAGAAAQILKDHHPSEFVCGGGASKPLAANATAAALQAAYNSALQDEVTLALQDVSSGNGVQIFCGTTNLGKTYLDIKVVVTTETQTNFAKLISRNEITTRVESIARVFPKQPFAYGNGLVSLSHSCGSNVGGIEFAGNSNVLVKHSGVFSNSCIKATSGSIIVNVEDGGINYITNCIGCSTAAMSPAPAQAPEPIPTDLLDPPICKNESYQNAPTSGEIGPGNYYGINAANNGTLILKPGLYCLKGDLKNGSQSTIKAERVTLYFLEGNVDISQNDKGEVSLRSPDCETADAGCGVPPAQRGVLMYFNPSKPHTVTLNGGSTNYFEGTIYGPNVTFKINGGSASDSFKTQIVGSYIYISGGSNLNMNLDGAEMWQDPSSIELLD